MRLKSITSTLLISTAALLTGCATTAADKSGSWEETSKYSSQSKETIAQRSPLYEAPAQLKKANQVIMEKFPFGGEDKIKLWVTDSHNLVDGIYTNRFGDALSPAPGIKMHKIMRGSNIAIIDPLHAEPCKGMETSPEPHWVIRTFITNYDENLSRKVEGFFPNVESSNIQAEIDHGNRTVTDRFGLKAKITDCRTGRIIHGAESTYLKTASTQDNSVYLFGKSLGMFYRRSHFTDPGLNQTRDLAMDMFLSDLALEIAGPPKQRP